MENIIKYEKRKNTELFKSMQSPNFTNVYNTQNYIPIYNIFFKLNKNNFNSINLNNKWYIYNIENTINNSNNIYSCILKDKNNQSTKIKKNVFFKIAPLLDPFKYMIGRYKQIDDSNLLTQLPNIESVNNSIIESKILDVNNQAYVDSFFSYLSSLLLHNYDFIHSVDFYGSFLGIKNLFKINIFDDLDYLDKSDYFHKHKNSLFEVDDYKFLFENTIIKEKLPHIKIENSSMPLTLSIKSINTDIYDDVFFKTTTDTNTNIDVREINELVDIIDSSFLNSKIELDKYSIKSKSSSYSSRTSYTLNDENIENHNDNEFLDLNFEKMEISSINQDEDKDEDKDQNKKEDEDKDEDQNKKEDDEYENEDEYEDEYEDDDEEEPEIFATIPKFPVQIICMENCEFTFDSLILNDELNSEEEWLSALMQIIMILLTYQKAFSFTHNDLHTNNIMINITEQKYIYYCYNNKYYKVPTHGRIFKIIDFGRSIYKFKENIFCSNSFELGGDASTQYNTEPYFNDKKPRLDPNFSFDLTRLACSIFDYLIEDINELEEFNTFDNYKKIIIEWCIDDNGLNILYKKNGDERYPCFKLYKMIARSCHNHTPQKQLERNEFKKFEINKKKIGKKENVINIDKIPAMF
jgi:hypothetical protein